MWMGLLPTKITPVCVRRYRDGLWGLNCLNMAGDCAPVCMWGLQDLVSRVWGWAVRYSLRLATHACGVKNL